MLSEAEDFTAEKENFATKIRSVMSLEDNSVFPALGANAQ